MTRFGVAGLLVLAVAVPACASAAESADARPRRLLVEPSWNDGIRFELRRVREPRRETWLFFPTMTFVTGRVGGRLHLDAATFATQGDVADPEADVLLRRGFVNVEGEIALRWPLRYRMEIGVRSEEPFLNALWFEHRRPSGWIVTAGQLDAPLSRERLTSSNAVTFLERAAPVRAFSPGTKAGVQIGRATDDRSVAWVLGVFGDARQSDGTETANGAPRTIGRLTWAPEAWTDVEHGRVLTLGVAGEYLLKRSTTLRYKAAPESAIAPHIVDTGQLDADHAFIHGLEAAWQHGPLVLEAEHLASVVDLEGGGPELLFGDYVAVSWLVTGEVRPYDRGRATFGMPTPKVPVSLRDRRWRGAVELGVRYSYLDLDAPGISGGRDHAVSLGLNWYWNRHVRLMFDYAATMVDGSKPDGTVHVLQTRLQLVY